MKFLSLKAETVQDILLVKANLKSFPLNITEAAAAEIAEIEEIIEEGISILDISGEL